MRPQWTPAELVGAVLAAPERRWGQWLLCQVQWDPACGGSCSMGRLCSRDGDWRTWALAQHWEKEGRSLSLTSVSYQLWQLPWLVGQILPVEVRRDRTRVTQLAGTGWQETDWGSVLSPPPVPGARLQAEPLGTTSTLARSSSERVHSGAGRAQKLGHRRTQGTLYFPGPVGDTLFTWVGVPRRLPVGAEHLPTWLTFGAASPELIPWHYL